MSYLFRTLAALDFDPFFDPKRTRDCVARTHELKMKIL
jgi:hypothetical protein